MFRGGKSWLAQKPPWRRPTREATSSSASLGRPRSG
jgi:hypothetical protein